jgi:[acyl-carrier-protein] S-malonyltransferase
VALKVAVVVVLDVVVINMKNVSFIFPGQGSQSIEMGKDFFENSKLAKELFQEAGQRIKVDFEKLLFTQNDDLSKTELTQPAILLVSSIAKKIFKSSIDIAPKFVLGHSLGEFSALVASGSLDLIDAVELVHKRGTFMNNACSGVGAGMMALIGLDDEKTIALCDELRNDGKSIWPANYNCDGQIVIAGIKKDLEDSVEMFKSAGAKRALVLAMNVSSHCPMLNVAVENLRPYLDEFITNDFNTNVISNVSTEAYSCKDSAIDLLTRQLVEPVLYKQSIIKHDNDIDLFLEFGNGSVLKGINRKITKTQTVSISDMKSLESALEILGN